MSGATMYPCYFVTSARALSSMLSIHSLPRFLETLRVLAQCYVLIETLIVQPSCYASRAMKPFIFDDSNIKQIEEPKVVVALA